VTCYFLEQTGRDKPCPYNYPGVVRGSYFLPVTCHLSPVTR
jgi:hypothetical protein